jgi:methylated-DNA-protein-cysteine methyltransferase related protein
MSSFGRAVEEVVGGLDRGEVVSYGEVAALAGRPGAARAVGSVLKHTEVPLPWWRVVTVDGRLAPGKEAEQGNLLRGEGVSVVGGRVLRRAEALGERRR